MAYQPPIVYGQEQVVVVTMPLGPHTWKVQLHESCCEAPGTCCYACCCPPCFVYQQRARLLAFTGEPYSCCQCKSIPRAGGCCSDPYMPPPAYAPAVWPPQPGNEPEILRDCQPELACEACCCAACALGGTRMLMMYKFGVTNSSCDDCCICCTVRSREGADTQDMRGELVFPLRRVCCALTLPCRRRLFPFVFFLCFLSCARGW